MKYRTMKHLAAIVVVSFLLVCVVSVTYMSSSEAEHSRDLSSSSSSSGDRGWRGGRQEDRMLQHSNPSHTPPAETKNLSSLPDYRVHVFYYPWYGSPVTDGRYLHWNHRYLPDWHKSSRLWPTGRHVPPHDLGSSFYPRLGPYSSRHPSVVSDHMRQIRASGAGVLVVSWYPPGLADDEGYNVDEVMPLILTQAHQHSLKVCIHIEPYKKRSVNTIAQDLTYINNTYSTHPAYYRAHTVSSPGGSSSSRSLPMFYIYDSYQIERVEWKRLLDPTGDLSVRGTSLDALFIGLLVDSSHLSDLSLSHFNGLYTYFVTDGFSYGSTWRNWVRLGALARDKDLMFIPCVGPGYDDTRLRPWNSANSRDRQQGEYYGRSLRAAIKSRPHIIAVTSFNEWGEGSQIEEAVPYTVSQQGSRAGFTYLDYRPHEPDFYLRLTKGYCEEYQRARGD